MALPCPLLTLPVPHGSPGDQEDAADGPEPRANMEARGGVLRTDEEGGARPVAAGGGQCGGDGCGRARRRAAGRVSAPPVPADPSTRWYWPAVSGVPSAARAATGVPCPAGMPGRTVVTVPFSAGSPVVADNSSRPAGTTERPAEPTEVPFSAKARRRGARAAGNDGSPTVGTRSVTSSGTGRGAATRCGPEAVNGCSGMGGPAVSTSARSAGAVPAVRSKASGAPSSRCRARGRAISTTVTDEEPSVVGRTQFVPP